MIANNQSCLTNWADMSLHLLGKLLFTDQSGL